jgi:serine/arginine repetitive matrix protein 2
LPLPTITHRPVPAFRRGSGNRARQPPSRRSNRAIIALRAPPHRRTAAPPHRRTAAPPHRRTATPPHPLTLRTSWPNSPPQPSRRCTRHLHIRQHTSQHPARAPGRSIPGAPHTSFRTARLRPLHRSTRTARPCSAAAIALAPCEPSSRLRRPLQRPSPAAQPDAPELKCRLPAPPFATLRFPPAVRLARPSASAAQHALECVHGPTAEISSTRKEPGGAQRAALRPRVTRPNGPHAGALARAARTRASRTTPL